MGSRENMTMYAVERWALWSRGASRCPGLHILALRVGYGTEPLRGEFDAPAQPFLSQSSILWPNAVRRGCSTVGLLAYVEVLPYDVQFEVVWKGPNMTHFGCQS